MRAILRYHLLPRMLALGVFESFIDAAAAMLGMILIYGSSYVSQMGGIEFVGQSIVFASVFLTTRFAVGLYNWECCSELKDVVSRTICAYVCGFGLLSAIFYLFPAVHIWRSAAAVSIPLAMAITLGTRYFLDRRVKGRFFLRRVLVIGTGIQAERIEHLERRKRQREFACVAYMEFANEERRVSSSRIISQVNSLPHYVAQHDIDEIVIAMADRRGRLPLQGLIECRLGGIKIRTYQNFLEKETGRVDPDALQPDWFLYSNGFPSRGLQQTIKRILDMAASLALIMVTLPIFIATMVAIKLEGEGPVFYIQERVGLRGRPFSLIKFRSMRPDAEEKGAPQWATVSDNRVTMVGRLIRKTRIDELPQLFNVLKGDMSFVGPRPERPFFVEQLNRLIPFYNERHEVKPGITGWAQLNYPYGASEADAKEKLAYDLYYVKYYSVIRDLTIMLQTMRVILWSHGAR